MARHLVLIGGGHAHMVTLSRLVEITGRGHRVTVIQPSEHHYYSGMGPGMLGRTYRPAEIRFATRRVVEKQGGRFVLDRLWLGDGAGQADIMCGDCVEKITGRNYDLSAAVNDEKVYPEVVKIIYDIQRQRTELITRDLRLARVRT